MRHWKAHPPGRHPWQDISHWPSRFLALISLCVPALQPAASVHFVWAISLKYVLLFHFSLSVGVFDVPMVCVCVGWGVGGVCTNYVWCKCVWVFVCVCVCMCVCVYVQERERE